MSERVANTRMEFTARRESDGEWMHVLAEIHRMGYEVVPRTERKGLREALELTRDAIEAEWRAGDYRGLGVVTVRRIHEAVCTALASLNVDAR